MTTDQKDDLNEHLRENRILILIFLLILLVLIWKPFRHETEGALPPELSGIENNLQIREVLQRMRQDGGGRLYPPRGFGGLAPHQDGTGSATGEGDASTAATGTGSD